MSRRSSADAGLAVRAAENCDDPAVIEGLYEELTEELGGEPSLVLAYHTTACVDVFDQWLADAKPGLVVGATSCSQIVTNQAVLGQPGAPTIGMLALRDPHGDYGAAAVPVTDCPMEAARAAYLEAVLDAGRPGELPALIMLHVSAIGTEEQTIQAIDELTGGSCPIVGGSSANDGDTSESSVVVGSVRTTEGIAVVTCFPDRPVSTSFQSGYTPTDRSGQVTAVEGTTIHQINDRPAAEVYNDWVDGAFDQALADGNSRALVESKTWCLGREIGQIRIGSANVPYYALFDPGGVTDENGLEVFVSVKQDEVVHLMTGDAASLPARAGNVLKSARDQLTSDVSGAVVVFCAGYRFAPEVDFDDVRRSLDDALEGQPFLLTFAFGEQGSLLGGESLHGNLMVSAAVFGTSP